MEYLLFCNHFLVIDNSLLLETKKWFFYIQVKYKLIDLSQENDSFLNKLFLQKDVFLFLKTRLEMMI